MEANTRAKDFFINLGAIVSLYTVVYGLIHLLFVVINTAYPQITDYYVGSESISWPVATLIVFFPIFVLLMWLLEKDFAQYPEKRNGGIHKWLVYITLFISGLIIAGDLITVLYYFLDGQELTMGFILKVLVLLVIAGSIFAYYLTDILDKGNAKTRKIYGVFALLITIGSIVWGFSVLGSPATQRLYRYDEQKINDLMSINNEATNYYATNNKLPESISGLTQQYYYINIIDPQTQQPYEYNKTSETTYELCTTFNKESRNQQTSYVYGGVSWSHPAGKYCFKQSINPDVYRKY